MAQLTEGSLKDIEDTGSNPVMLLSQGIPTEKTKIKKKRPGITH